MSSEALEKLSVIREKAEMEKQHYDELQEVIPVALTEKLGQIHSLEDSIKVHPHTEALVICPLWWTCPPGRAIGCRMWMVDQKLLNRTSTA